jgi:tRNA dimethylallyltransferase
MKSGKYSVNKMGCHLNSFCFQVQLLFFMSQSLPQPLLVLVGPTGVGKTAMSFGLAKRFSAEIISMDSMQVYKYMDIGTAKATTAQRALVPHHLIDFVDPGQEYNTNMFVEDCRRVASEVAGRGNIPLLVGGTGLYLQALLFGLIEIPPVPAIVRQQIQDRIHREGNQVLHDELAGFDPETAQRVHVNDTQRLIRGLEIYQATGKTWSSFLAHQKKQQAEFNSGFAPVLIGLRRERDELYKRIDCRVDQMLEQGLLDEVKALLAKGYGPQLGAMQAIGYKHMAKYCLGYWSYGEAVRLLKRDTRRYAKRQFTWFRDKGITWFHPDKQADVEHFAEQTLQGRVA